MSDGRIANITELADKARAMQAAHETCESAGGHYYNVDGFSLIAHPEVFWTGHPHVKSLSDVVFRAYVCSSCGCRVAVKEGREYMAAKHARLAPELRAAEEARRLRAEGYFSIND